ncbi:MAG: hypothetical protein H8E34_10400 [Bacteroidetes bacterium]|nr:hypothetical protein [Bacteroidota bacterium]
MKATFETENENEILMFAQAKDMALLLWELKNNFWRKWKHDESGFNLDTFKDELQEIFYEYGIDIDKIID